MKSNTEKALEYFDNNFNCAQSVFSSFSEKYGLNEEQARRIASGLGGGFRCGEVCGAVSGAVLVIGLKYGQSRSEDLEAKRYCNSKAEEFIRTYRERFDSVICRDLLGCDISTDTGREKAIKESLFQTVCKDAIANSVMLLEELGY